MPDSQFPNRPPAQPPPPRPPGDLAGSSTVQMPMTGHRNDGRQPTDAPPFLQETSWQAQPGAARPAVRVSDWLPAVAGIGVAVLLVLTIVAAFLARPQDADADAAPSAASSANQAPDSDVDDPAVAAAPASTTTTTQPTTTTTAPTTTADPFLGYPSAEADSAEISWGRGDIDVLANDDPGAADFDIDSLEIVTEPEHARSVKVSGGQIQYRSDLFYTGDDFLEYMICNQLGNCSIAAVTISVGF